jgi:hypothetical protein
VATDDDMKDNAEKLLNRELTGAISNYLKLKNKGEMVKNINLDNRFKKLKVWEESENE